MSASPEFHNGLLAEQWEDEEGYYCRTPTGSEIKEPATCPPAPRKPPPAARRKHPFDVQALSLRSEELERLFRPQPPPKPQHCDKRRRSPDKRARAT